MPFRAPTSTQPAPAAKAKRYGWFRTYNDFATHPKWRALARKTGVHVSRVTHVVMCLLATASKNRKAGWIGNFDLEDCAETCDMPVEEVGAVYRELELREWLAEDFIAEWADRNPDQEDPTAAERQRRRRARIIVRKKIAHGKAISQDEAALITSRVTPAGYVPPARTQALGAFVIVEPQDESIEAANTANMATASNARAYLVGEGKGASDWGVASAIVADRMGMRRFAADTTIRRWLGELDGDVVALATLIDDANHDGLGGDRFESIIRQGIGRIAAEKHRGPTLPLGPAVVAGGRRA